MWTVVSLNVAGFFSAGDDGVQILLNLDEFTEPILAPETPRDRLTERLERVVRGAQFPGPSTSPAYVHCPPTLHLYPSFDLPHTLHL
jgi:hypothetical protein